jgi:hypothetical protein
VNGSVPLAVHENLRAQSNVDKRRLWIVVIILIVLLFGSNLAWLIYESQFEMVQTETTNSYEIEQDATDGGTNYAIGRNFYGNAEDQDYEDHEDEDTNP